MPRSRHRRQCASGTDGPRWGRLHVAGRIAAGRIAAGAGMLFILAATSAQAQVWRFGSSISVLETLTDNANLQPNGSRQSDLISQITPAFTATEKGAHTSLSALVSLPLVYHARTSSENNALEPQVSVLGNAELVPKFFFIEGAATVSQQFLSPFGPQPASLANSTANRYTNASYRVTPYIQGQAGNDLSYLLRDSVLWTRNYGTSSLTSNSTSNLLTGNVARAPRPFGWAFDIERDEIKYTNQASSLVTELARAHAIYQIDPQVQLELRGGYEHDDYGLGGSFGNAVYGAGASWRPDDRTSVDGWWEHRHFGGAYQFNFSHRMRLTTWSLQASRDQSTYPQLLANFPAGLDLSSVLNQLFLSRFPDPVARQAAVTQFLQSSGLPSTLGSPVALYTEQVTLHESLVGSVGLLGVRNGVFLSVFRTHDEQIAGQNAAFIPGLILGNNTTQYGTSVSWSHTLAPRLTLTTSLTASRSEGNAPVAPNPVTRQGTAQTLLAAQLSPRTNVFAGARYQVSRSNLAFEYNEAAIFAGLVHQFQ